MVVQSVSKQDMTADSTTRLEYIAASEAAKEAVWIRKFIAELGVVLSIVDLIPLYTITMEPLHKQRNHGLIIDPNTYL